VVDEARKLKKELLLFNMSYFVVMARINFRVLRRKWMLECIGSTTASVLVNGSPIDEFPLERRLRQGNPLSPFLFFIAIEGLNVIMCSMVTRYKVGRDNSMQICHL